MVNPVTGAGNVSSSLTVAEATPRKAPDAAGVRPTISPTKNCMEDPYTLIQAISNAFGYREAGMLSKADLRSPVSMMTYPARGTNAIELDSKKIAQRDAMVDKLTDEAWSQLMEKGYIDANGAIQGKFMETSEKDFVLSFNSGENTRVPDTTKEIYDIMKRSERGEVESRISSSYITERSKAGFGKLPYRDVILLLNTLNLLGYVPDATPGKTEVDTRAKLTSGLAGFQSKHPEIDVKKEDLGNRVGVSTITAIVKELQELD